MRKPQLYVSGKRPIDELEIQGTRAPTIMVLTSISLDIHFVDDNLKVIVWTEIIRLLIQVSFEIYSQGPNWQ